MQVHLSLKSSNVKTGPIPVSTTTRDSCPSSCPFKENGCYADQFPMALHWNKVTTKERGTDWATFCDKIATLPEGQLWRHNQAGDLPLARREGTKIDRHKMIGLVLANKGKRGFTYTHHKMTIHNQSVVDAANRQGFTVNLSANSIDEVDDLLSLDIGPVVVTIPEGMKKTFKTEGGAKIVTCPATYKDDVSCATCKLCAVAKRKSVIAFPFHGSKKKSLNERYTKELEDV